MKKISLIHKQATCFSIIATHSEYSMDFMSSADSKFLRNFKPKIILKSIISKFTKMTTNNFKRKMKSLVAVTSCSSLILAGLLYNKNDEKFFDNFAMPLVNFVLSPENAHKLGIFLCKWSLIPKNSYVDPSNLVKIIILIT